MHRYDDPRGGVLDNAGRLDRRIDHPPLPDPIGPHRVVAVNPAALHAVRPIHVAPPIAYDRRERVDFPLLGPRGWELGTGSSIELDQATSEASAALAPRP